MSATAMTRTEAAEIVANATVAWGRQNGLIDHRIPDKDLVEARLSELRVTAVPGTYLHTAAVLANWRTTLRLLNQWWR